MRDELAVETIENSFQIGRNHPMIQQSQILEEIAKKMRRFFTKWVRSSELTFQVPKTQQTSTGNQNQVVGNVSESSTVIRDVHGDVYFSNDNRRVAKPPFQVPPLPQHFVERPQHYKAIKKLLLSQEVNRPGTLVVSAIYGLGGIGKSTMAAALAHDPDVQKEFPDGVLWATLGQQPNLLSLLRNWIQALGDRDYEPKTPDHDDASKHLRTLLHNKKVLLIVDDAWKPKHVEPFRVGGSGCRVLVTTREATIKGATRYDLDVLTPKESLELLQKSRGEQFNEKEQQQAQQLAEIVGFLPLALDLAAAQVAEGVTWAKLLNVLQAEIAHLEALELRGGDDSSRHEEKRRDFSLIASFNLSLRSLTPELLRQFAWLGVLPEDVLITEVIGATLWDMSTTEEALEILRSLKSKSLLLPGATRTEEKPTYRLHDLMLVMAKRLLTSELSPHDPKQLPGLGLKTLAAAHSVLLERYRNKTQQGLWYTLEDDGYIYEYLSWHLEQAGKSDELHSLLKQETQARRNAWYEACERQGQTAYFIADVRRAWQLAEKMFEENPSESIALQCRYALIITSLNSLTKNIPAGLMAALVEKGLWTPVQGLVYAQQVKESYPRAEAINKLAPYLPEFLLPDALEIAHGIQDDSHRFEALSGLVPYLPKIVGEALSIACSSGRWSRADDLITLAPHLPEELVGQALEAACSIQEDYQLIKALSGLARYVPKELLGQALKALNGMEYDYKRGEALSVLAPYLPKDLLKQALEAACSIQHPSGRTDALSGLAPYLPENLLKQALEAARTIQYEEWRAIALRGLAPHLSEALLRQALKTTCDLQNDKCRAYGLSGLAPYLPEILREGAEAAFSIQEGYYRANALSGLAPYLPQEMLGQAIEAACSIEENDYRANALSQLAPYLPQELLRQALETACSIEKNDYSPDALSQLAPYLPQELLLKALEATCEKNDDRADALIKLARHLPEELLGQALEAACGIEKNDDRVDALIKLAPHLPQELLLKALEVAHSIQNNSFESGYHRIKALNGIAPYLPKELLRQALVVVGGIKDDKYRAYALKELASHLPEELLEPALEAARAIQDKLRRVYALSEIALYLSESSELAPYLSELEILREALKVVYTIQNNPDHVYALRELAPQLPPELLEEALELACAIQDDKYYVYALRELASHLPKELLPKALETARAIQDDKDRAEALIELAPYLPDIRQEALEAARAIQDDKDRADALIELAPDLPDIQQEALEAVCSLQDNFSRTWKLKELAPRLLKELLPKALEAACSIESDSNRADALKELAPHLPQELLRQALKTARAIQDDDARAEALSGLALYLPEIQQEALEAVCSINFNISPFASIPVKATIKPVAYLPKTLRKVLEAVCIINIITNISPFGPMRVQALVKLAPLLPEKLLRQALKAARNIGAYGALEYHNAEVISELAPYLPKELLPKALEATFNSSLFDREEALGGLAPYLSEKLLSKALEATCTIDDWRRPEVLRRLAPHLPKELLPKALEAACSIQSDSSRADALSGLAPHLPKELLPKALEAARAIQNDKDRAEAFSNLLSVLDLASIEFQLWCEIIHNLSHLYRSELLRSIPKLSNAIVARGGIEALVATVRAIEEVCRQWQ